jgi:hypothetical protein
MKNFNISSSYFMNLFVEEIRKIDMKNEMNTLDCVWFI